MTITQLTFLSITKHFSVLKFFVHGNIYVIKRWCSHLRLQQQNTNWRTFHRLHHSLTGQIIKAPTNNYRLVLKMQMLSPAVSSTCNVCELGTDKGMRFTLRRVMSCYNVRSPRQVWWFWILYYNKSMVLIYLTLDISK